MRICGGGGGREGGRVYYGGLLTFSINAHCEEDQALVPSRQMKEGNDYR